MKRKWSLIILCALIIAIVSSCGEKSGQNVSSLEEQSEGVTSQTPSSEEAFSHAPVVSESSSSLKESSGEKQDSSPSSAVSAVLEDTNSESWITEAEAEKIFAELYPKVEIERIQLERKEGGKKQYFVFAMDDSYKYKVAIDAKTGEVSLNEKIGLHG